MWCHCLVEKQVRKTVIKMKVMKTSLYLFIALLLLCGGCEKALPGFAEEWHGVQFILDGEYKRPLTIE